MCKNIILFFLYIKKKTLYMDTMNVFGIAVVVVVVVLKKLFYKKYF